MTTLREAAQQALEALELWKVDFPSSWAKHDEKAIKDLKDALRESVQKGCNHCNHPLYAAIKCRVCGRAHGAE